MDTYLLHHLALKVGKELLLLLLLLGSNLLKLLVLLVLDHQIIGGVKLAAKGSIGGLYLK